MFPDYECQDLKVNQTSNSGQFSSPKDRTLNHAPAHDSAYVIKFIFVNRLEKKGVTKDERVANLEKEIMKRKAMLHEIKAALPKQNGLYLRIILGNVNVSILNKNDK